MKRGLNLSILVLLGMLLPAAAFALDSFFVSPRAMGMGGAQVVSVRDASAQYYNPAAFGFYGQQNEQGENFAADRQGVGDKSWGIDIGGSVGYRLHGEFGSYVDDLADIDLDLLEQDGVQTESDLQDLIALVGALNGIDEPDTGITVDAAGGGGMQAGHFAVGVRGYTQVSSRVLDLDDQNLGFAGDIDALNTGISGVVPTGYVDNGVTELFTDEQVALLYDGGAGFSLDAIQKLDYVALEYGITASEAADVVDLLVAVADSTESGSSDLADNTTTVALTGFGYREVPISYGYALNENFAIGGNFKLMKGRVYANQLLVFDNDSGDLLDESDELYQETDTFGIDLGVMARFQNLSFGLMGRNLNSPEFDGFSRLVTLSSGATATVTAADVTIDPQLTAGVAFMPLDSLVLEVNCDLTENDTTLTDYATRNLSFGLEWNPIGVLALRAGAYKNLAEDDIDLVYTAGLGLNLWVLQFDIAGTYSDDSYEYDGEDLPQETRVAAELSVLF